MMTEFEYFLFAFGAKMHIVSTPIFIIYDWYKLQASPLPLFTFYLFIAADRVYLSLISLKCCLIC